MTSKSLSEFSKTFPAKSCGAKAWIEGIPEFEEVVEAWQNGISAQTIRVWLIEERGYDSAEATRNRIYNRLHEKFPRS